MINSAESQSRKKIINTIFFIVYVAFMVIFSLRHENYRDEAQAWLMARDLNISQLLSQMKYEGHPCLWHLIIMPLAKLNFPFWSMKVVSGVINCITAGIIIKKAPFGTVLKALLLFSAGFFTGPVFLRAATA